MHATASASRDGAHTYARMACAAGRVGGPTRRHSRIRGGYGRRLERLRCSLASEVGYARVCVRQAAQQATGVKLSGTSSTGPCTLGYFTHWTLLSVCRGSLTSRLQSSEEPIRRNCWQMRLPYCSFHFHTSSRNFSRPRSCLCGGGWVRCGTRIPSHAIPFRCGHRVLSLSCRVGYRGAGDTV